jgi:hypothetical protein
MSRILSMAAAVALIACAGATTIMSAKAADVSAGRRVASNQYCQQIWRCGPAGCNWHRVCSRLCPDGSYTCSPLYGAYGPYGGTSYWGAYTDAGWDYYR